MLLQSQLPLNDVFGTCSIVPRWILELIMRFSLRAATLAILALEERRQDRRPSTPSMATNAKVLPVHQRFLESLFPFIRDLRRRIACSSNHIHTLNIQIRATAEASRSVAEYYATRVQRLREGWQTDFEIAHDSIDILTRRLKIAVDLQEHVDILEDENTNLVDQIGELEINKTALLNRIKGLQHHIRELEESCQQVADRPVAPHVAVAPTLAVKDTVSASAMHIDTPASRP